MRYLQSFPVDYFNQVLHILSLSPMHLLINWLDLISFKLEIYVSFIDHKKVVKCVLKSSFHLSSLTPRRFMALSRLSNFIRVTVI